MCKRCTRASKYVAMTFSFSIASCIAYGIFYLHKDNSQKNMLLCDALEIKLDAKVKHQKSEPVSIPFQLA
jgi:hypothetical protein